MRSYEYTIFYYRLFLDSQVTRSRDSRATSLLRPRRRATIASAGRATTRGNRGVNVTMREGY